MSFISTRSIARVAVGLVFTATATVPLMTAASADTNTDPSPAKSVTVFLKAPNPHGLAALARNHTLSHNERIAAVKQLLPTAAQHEQAAKALRAQGFTVTDESSWSVTASAPATTVAAVFGARPKLAAHATVAQRAAATGALPDLPASLSSVASAAFPTTGGPAAFGHIKVGGRAHRPANSRGKPGDALTNSPENYGYDFQDAYEAPSLTKAGGAPASGRYRSQRLTIATLQFTGWNPGDLSDYADAAGLPYSSSTITQVPVDQASIPPADDTGADLEVDLDQESILSTDPYAHQRAYFAPNNDAGFDDAFSQVVDDVTGVDAYNGGDAHIGALSVSWGSCEAQNDAGAIDAAEPIIESLVAAGVTVFASSGDSGAYDCTSYDVDGNPVDATVGVDYPASSPVVIGVGGTNLSSQTAAFNNGSNWSETAWSCTTVTDCFTDPDATGGSGGGVSDTFPEPSYQSSTLSTTQNDRGGRLVPDIAVEGDPATGFIIDTTDPTLLPYGQYWQVGGTSLASPVSAALFTAMLSDHGRTTGIGDIHSNLYNAPSSA
ncbi:MAG: S53 family peptidase, partial [Nocardioidaceae bacterium]